MEYLQSLQKGGFNFDNCHRNNLLIESNAVKPTVKKTGTTIVGVTFKDGVVLAADTRATSDTTVAEKNCAKIHYLAPNIYCCGAGTAADCEHVTEKMSSELELLRLNTGRVSRVMTAASRLQWNLWQYRGNIGAALIIAGVDPKGKWLAQLSPEGTTSYLPYCAMGSGSLAAIAILEAKFRDGLTQDEAVDLVQEAIEAGIFHDLGSGSNVDVCIITAEKTDYRRNYRVYNKKEWVKPTPYSFPPRNTPILREHNIKLEVVPVGGERVGMEIEK
eukprot:TRINITY_DN13618_c0_g2_i2.p1 TRINITY_DN13618_c0_g2~~TRINITY_DN13618_c0_g2_i2.p1  ORF type:complete len:274 (+),score=79.02 TRINITY_DN13618_c0_g2_i2:157-978(+)